MMDAARCGHVFAALYDGEGHAREAPQASLPEAAASRRDGPRGVRR